ncbi:hypothetical protein K461DRAFT_317050 [Myriangium duriaei CBS 260.36]|uniref:Tyrosine specific protein phosphatases domain-containing protein n=1 Tax=Myriangium duriaei CBS 260.36 TaxID=1168546 RepID=A0A9P4JD76_9PEZI|nr:hypothetical protein K461DRAFT_317050 [Myriangium duriaei CBS 260.36]
MAANDPPPGVVKFDNIVNFRDVGLYTCAISKTQRIKPHLLYRSARPDLASPSDLSTLTGSLAIHTIFDLRTRTEQTSLSPPNPPSSSIPTSRINLTGLLFRLRLMSHLPFLSILSVIWLFLTRQRLAAIRVLATVMGPRGLSGMAEDTLSASWREIREVFARLAEPEAWPVLVHCTQGKDRTGLVVLLLSLLAGVELSACQSDYMLSQRELQSDRDERLADSRKYGLPEAFVDCEDGWVEHVVGYINSRWGGVEAYLAWCGVPDNQVRFVKDTLTITNE